MGSSSGSVFSAKSFLRDLSLSRNLDFFAPSSLFVTSADGVGDTLSSWVGSDVESLAAVQLW